LLQWRVALANAFITCPSGNRRSGISDAEEFFEVCFAYHSPKSYDAFLVMIRDFIVQYFAQEQVGQPCFWFNKMTIISQVFQQKGQSVPASCSR
jgi:hypothetical protein